jgi:type III pantothenate kinase
MNLSLDIGNTRTKIGLFQENILVEQAIWTDWTLDELISYGKDTGVDAVVFSSVAEHDPAQLQNLRRHFTRAYELTHLTSLPFRNAYGTPETLGKDRLAAVAGAHALFPGQHCLVVDCGTCIKYDMMLAEGVYPGGNIAPGLQMRVRAMHEYTARLPLVPLEMPTDIVGNSTETALQNGALRGAELEVEGFVKLFEQQWPDVVVILTGGDAPLLLPHLDLHRKHHEPALVLHGLNHILQHLTRAAQ